MLGSIYICGKKNVHTLVIFWIYILGKPVQGRETDEQRLISHLLKNNSYDAAARPVYNASKSIQVSINFNLDQLYLVDALKQQMVVIGWMHVVWFDEVLQWDPNDFGGLKVIVLPSNKVWVPPIALDNSAGNIINDDYKFFKTNLNYKGNIYMQPGGELTSVCNIDVTYYPFDKQTCQLIISGWDYTESLVNYTTGEDTVNLDNYQESGEWEILNTKSEHHVTTYNCCPDKIFTEAIFTFYLQRKPGFYITNIVVPCILLVFLDLLVFIVPTESGEKIALGMTVLLAFSVFSLLIIEQVPKTSDATPVIVSYLTFCMTMSGVSVALSVFVLHMYHNAGAKQPPNVLMRHLVRKKQKVMQNESFDFELNKNTNGTTDNETKQDQDQILKQIQTYKQMAKKNQEKAEIIQNWRTLALKLENIFAVLFVVVNLIAALVMLIILPSRQTNFKEI